MADKPRGKPFTKDDPRRGKSPGRPRKTVEWKTAEDELRAALPRLMMMSAKELKDLVKNGLSVVDELAIAYIREHPVEAVNRFIGKPATPLTGADGKPLIPPAAPAVNVNLPAMDFSSPLWTPEALAKFIDATAAAGKKA